MWMLCLVRAVLCFFSCPLGSVQEYFPHAIPIHPLGGRLYLHSDPCRNHCASSMPACRSASLAAGYFAFMNAESKFCFRFPGERIVQKVRFDQLISYSQRMCGISLFDSRFESMSSTQCTLGSTFLEL